MELFNLEYWPLLFICAAMIASGVIDWWIFKVPNWLTFPVIFSGWAYGLVHTLDWQIGPETGAGGLGASLAGTFFGFALLVPLYAIGGMGAGDVKMAMGFGAWIGAFYGLNGRSEQEMGCLSIILYAYVAGVIIGGVLGLLMILARRQFDRNIQHTKEILGDLWNAPSEAAARANARRPRWHRLPYGVPLCIGFVGYLFLAGPHVESKPPDQNAATPKSSLAAPGGTTAVRVTRLGDDNGSERR